MGSKVEGRISPPDQTQSGRFWQIGRESQEVAVAHGD